jgi:hypothetical protein
MFHSSVTPSNEKMPTRHILTPSPHTASGKFAPPATTRPLPSESPRERPAESERIRQRRHPPTT